MFRVVVSIITFSILLYFKHMAVFTAIDYAVLILVTVTCSVLAISNCFDRLMKTYANGSDYLLTNSLSSLARVKVKLTRRFLRKIILMDVGH